MRDDLAVTVMPAPSPAPNPFLGLTTARKHAPGQHDQKTHGNRAGSRGIPDITDPASLLSRLDPDGFSSSQLAVTQRTLAALESEFPGVASRIYSVHVGECSLPGVDAEAHRDITGTGYIRVNPAVASAPRHAYEAHIDWTVASGHNAPDGPGLENVIRHEFGHHIAWAIGPRRRHEIIRRVLSHIGTDGLGTREARQAIESDISSYATMDTNELFAEAFTEYHWTGGQTQSKLVTIIGAQMVQDAKALNWVRDTG